MVKAWFVNDAEVAADQRNPSKGDNVDLHQLKKIGVEYYQVRMLKKCFINLSI